MLKDFCSDAFLEALNRLEALQAWRELAIRPDPCPEEDNDMLENEKDDLRELAARSKQARAVMNANLPKFVSALEKALVPAKSQIAGAGKGLYYRPVGENISRVIPQGTILCYYYGHIHDFHSIKLVEDQSYMMLVAGSLHVDPRPCLDIKARYANDPLNEYYVNCKFVPDPEFFRSAVVSTKDIEPNAEIFASYGPMYWENQSYKGSVYSGS